MQNIGSSHQPLKPWKVSKMEEISREQYQIKWCFINFLKWKRSHEHYPIEDKNEKEEVKNISTHCSFQKKEELLWTN